MYFLFFIIANNILQVLTFYTINLLNCSVPWVYMIVWNGYLVIFIKIFCLTRQTLEKDCRAVLRFCTYVICNF